MTTILFLAADPSDAARLRLGEEAREIQEKLQLATMRERFAFEQRWAVRPQDLSQALLDEKPQIVHFSGHGTSAGAICLEDQSGRTHPVERDALEALFELVAGHVQCVVLNACYSETQASAIGKHIPYVIGMSNAISDKAAIAFAVGFYQALGGGRSVDDAYKFGCVQIRLQGIPEHLTPVLIKMEHNRSHSGRLFYAPKPGLPRTDSGSRSSIIWPSCHTPICIGAGTSYARGRYPFGPLRRCDSCWMARSGRTFASCTCASFRNACAATPG